MSEREDRPELHGTISASQLETYSLCPRKWAWRKMDRVILPPNHAAEFGIKVHSQLERYLSSGTPLDLTTEAGECAMSGVHHLPPPGTVNMTVEGEFILSGWNHRFFGLKDVQITDSAIPLVIDHKTTSDFKWAKDENVLATDIQAALYAADAMVRFKANACDLRWIYYRTRRPFKSKPINIRVTREDISPTLERIKYLADEISLIRSAGLMALELPYNPSACDAFGGCAYQALCNLTPSDRMSAIMSSTASPIDQAEKDALYARIREKQAQAGGAGAAVNPPLPPPPPPVAGIPAGAPMSPDGKHWWDGSNWQPVPAASAPPPPPPVAASAPAVPAAAPRRRGRPPASAASAASAATSAPPPVAASAPATPPGPASAFEGISTAESMLAEAYETIGNGFIDAAEAIRHGALQ